ncbi:hypothetical protein [Nocardia thailandica]|uniref:hypothetical protein n=1 Tax=Nocardia thailandica TaxID=257275 RepID=UPI0012F89D46|nr:hypothetical protein [Nocardia thailandica]
MHEIYPSYYSYCGRPLRVEKDPDGRLMGFILDPLGGHFERAVSGIVPRAESSSNNADIWQMDREEFIIDAERTRAQKVSGVGPIFSLYAVVLDLDAKVKRERRTYSDAERKFIRSTLFRTYAMWEQEAEFVDPAPIPDA